MSEHLTPSRDGVDCQDGTHISGAAIDVIVEEARTAVSEMYPFHLNAVRAVDVSRTDAPGAV